MFACKNGVGMSILDAIGMGRRLYIGPSNNRFCPGNTLGQVHGWVFHLQRIYFDPAIIMDSASGRFLAFGFVVAAIQKFSVLKIKNKEIATGCGMNCAGCAQATTEVTGNERNNTDCIAAVFVENFVLSKFGHLSFSGCIQKNIYCCWHGRCNNFCYNHIISCNMVCK